MGSSKQMKRGVSQAIYKYLPESWIDFYVRGKERKQYIAKVLRWNSNILEGVNKKRLIRVVNTAVQSFASQGGGKEVTIGFGAQLTVDNCEVHTPRVSEEERGVVAEISPLTFYCAKCKKVYQFKDSETYKRNRECKKCQIELKQFRQIYFCKCGYATDHHPVRCSNSEHGSKYIRWDEKFNFWCTKCNTKIPMIVKCPNCNATLGPKTALDPAQFFTKSLNIIDLIDEKLENFITNTDYGKFAVMAYWLNKITDEELNDIINKGINVEESKYQAAYDMAYNTFKDIITDKEQLHLAASKSAAMQCGRQYDDVINTIRLEMNTSLDSMERLAESILEFKMVKDLKESSTLSDAVKAARLLNTNANPEEFWNIANRYGIKNAKVCDKIPFVSCAYGYTRAEFDYKDGVQLHALKEVNSGTKNVFAVKTNTEGVLFELDNKKIIEWLLDNNFISQEDAPDLDSEAEIKMWFANNIRPDLIKPFNTIDKNASEVTYHVYRLLHSISHLLIRAVADIGGLGKDSLSEYIFPGVPAILVYCHSAQGFSLGALFNTFEAYFDKWLLRADKISQKCIFDPICLERQKACTGCLFLNEISCEHFNKDLDRSYVAGYYDKVTNKKVVGFWEEK